MNSIDNQNMFIDFNSIFASWDNNVSSSDIYHMILNWINQYKSYIKSIHIIENILERMESNDSTNDIVEDFIYGNIYQELRDEFQS
jgi:capsular polysaccharide biosynthesis protein